MERNCEIPKKYEIILSEDTNAQTRDKVMGSNK